MSKEESGAHVTACGPSLHTSPLVHIAPTTNAMRCSCVYYVCVRSLNEYGVYGSG